MLTPRKDPRRSRFPGPTKSFVGGRDTCVFATFRGDSTGRRKRAASFFLLLMLALFCATSSQAQTAAGTNIDNVARAEYEDGGGNRIPLLSNLNRVTTTVTRTPSTVEFLKYGLGIPSNTQTEIGLQTCSTTGNPGGPYIASPSLTDFSGAPIDVNTLVPLVADGAYHAGEPVFIRVIDLDQNLDPAIVETVELNLISDGGDRETLLLSENGPNTGTFIGYIQSATPPPVAGDCRISVAPDETIRAEYTDPIDGTDASSDVTLVDPFGVVFDSATGAPVDGATIVLWDVLAGGPASVVGDDGLSAYPSSVISGGTATDASGQVYNFGPGRFRFPFVAPGQYQLRVTPPATHVHPSGESDTTLQTLPGAPYALVLGSRGETFTVPVGPAVQVDIPLDPLSTGLLVSKQTGRDRAGVGEFVPYRLMATNATGTTLVSATFVDRLPVGFRYEEGSGAREGVGALEPTISDDGRELVFDLGNVVAGDSLVVSYVARVTPDTPPGFYPNRVTLEAQGGIRSNLAEAMVEVEQDLFDRRSYLVGRVHIDACELEPDEPAAGLEGVKVYLEDGSFVLTDEEGRFHFEAISAGLHVVQLDLESIPDEYEAHDCEDGRQQRRAGRAFSEFVEIQPGSLWRSDFHVKTRAPAQGVLSQALSAEIVSGDAEVQDRVRYQLEIENGRLPARDLSAMISLPAGLSVDRDSIRLADEVTQSSVEGETLVVPIAVLEANARRVLRFEAIVSPIDASSSEDRTEPVETRAILRGRTGMGRAVMTPPAVVRFALPGGEDVAPQTAAPALPEPIADPPMPSFVLDHRLLSDRRNGVMEYVLQVYVTEEVPDVIVAEVELPAHQSLLPWTPRNELGRQITSVQVEGRTRFILPKEARREAVRVFLHGDVAQHVLQIFFSAEQTGSGSALATSRILPGVIAPPAAPAGGTQPKLSIDAVNPSPTKRTPRRLASPSPSPSNAKRSEFARARADSVMRARSEVVLRDVELDSKAQATRTEPVSKPVPRLAAEAARFDAEWLSTAPLVNGFAYPAPDVLPRIPSLRLGLQHTPDVRIELTRNGIPVDEVHLEGRIRNQDKTLALSRYRGVGLEEGPNVFVAVFRDASGREVERAERVVHLSGAPVRGELVEEASTLVADGRVSPVVAMRLYDRWGKLVRAGSTGQFELDPPYQTEEEVEAARKRPLAGIGFERPSFVVEEDGLARVRLHPTSVVGEARLRFQFREGREDELVAWLEPGDRDWVLVGLATGTLGWNQASGSDAQRRLGESEEGLYQEGRVAFFAKGRVPGRFLVTAAYDSDASNTRLRNRLFQTLDPDEHYTLYGDTTTRDFDAPTSGKLYLKVERKKFYALYGDYQTGLEETELGRYARTLTGAKLEYRGDHFEANAFVTDSDQSFVKDEILGDGTSGLYRLSRERIVPGSETITIETRDRFRPEIVVTSEPQARFTDYDIDYDDGTLFFRRPIPRQDGNFDPIFIVVDYETNDRSPNAVTGGGRVAGKALEGRVEVGFTGIHEGGDQIDSQLFATDATIQLDDTTELRAEFAHSRGDDFSGEREGEAWLVELDHRGEVLDLRAYAKEQGRNFGLGQQRGTGTELRSYGIDAGFDWTQTLRSQTSLFRQENLATGSKRHVAELQSQWEKGRYGLNGGARYSGDDTAEGTGHAVQVLGGGRADFFDGRFSLRAEGEAAVVEDTFGDFPHRATVGADWAIHKRLTMFVDQEMSFGEDQRTADTRGGFRGTPWTGATVTTSVVQEQREFGPRTYANLGLQQRWDLFTNWGFDLSIDRTATIRDPGNRAFNTDAPAASGSFNDDYTAVSLGTAYREGAWSGTGRLEARFGENEDRWGFIAGLLHDEDKDLAWSARFDLFYSNARSGAEELRTDTSLSLAYRPLRSHWIVLDRLDFEYRDNTGGDFDFESRKLLHHLKVNQLFGRGTQLAWQLSNKLVIDTISNRQFTTFGTLAGVEMRRDIQKGWDMSVHGRVRHQTSGDEMAYGYGLSVGRILVDNVWLSLGYNLVGFTDPEFSAADYTAQGPFFRIRAKFDQLSVKDALELFR